MCLNPITIKKFGIDVPCGHCAECCTKAQNGWLLRFREESKCWKYTYFVTYTYDNERVPYILFDLSELSSDNKIILEKSLNSNIPTDNMYVQNHMIKAAQGDIFSKYLFYNYLGDKTWVPYLRKLDISSHMKRVRRSFQYYNKRNLEMKYFIQGEYGPATLRPHWHGIIFTNERYESIVDYFTSDWQENYGVRCDFQLAKNVGSVSSYVSKYVSKIAEFENPYVLCGFLPRSYRVVSKGIGRNYRDNYFTDEVKKQRDNVSSEQDYESFHNEHCKYPIQTNNGVLLYSKPRYWTEIFLPKKLVSKLQTKVVYYDNKKRKFCHPAYRRPKSIKDKTYPFDRFIYNTSSVVKEVVDQLAEFVIYRNSYFRHLFEIEHFKRVQMASERFFAGLFSTFDSALCYCLRSDILSQAQQSLSKHFKHGNKNYFRQFNLINVN